VHLLQIILCTLVPGSDFTAARECRMRAGTCWAVRGCGGHGPWILCRCALGAWLISRTGTRGTTAVGSVRGGPTSAHKQFGKGVKSLFLSYKLCVISRTGAGRCVVVELKFGGWLFALLYQAITSPLTFLCWVVCPSLLTLSFLPSFTALHRYHRYHRMAGVGRDLCGSSSPTRC